MKSGLALRRGPWFATLLAVWLATPAAAQAPWAVWVMDADGENAKKVSRDDKNSFGSPAWSRDGKKLAYDTRSALSHILVQTLANGTIQDIGLGHTPSFSPDDQQVAYFFPGWTQSGQKPGVWVMNADGTNREWISEGERPRWSADGDKLVFASSHEGYPSLYVYDTISLERTRILDRGYNQIVGAAFSPDAGQLVFVAYKEGTIVQNSAAGELAVVDARSGAKPTSLCQGRVGWHPDWSPQGKKLLFRIADAARNEQLQILDLEATGKPEPIPKQFGRRNCDGAWSPDGKRIVFTSDRG